MLSFNRLHQEFEPPEELRDIIKCFWYNKKDFGELQSSFEVLPDGYAEIIFHFGSPCSILYNGRLQELPSPFVMGLLDQPAHFYTKNTLQIIGIRCFPWTVFKLLGLSSNKDRFHLFEHPIVQLRSSLEKYIKVGNIDEAFHQLTEYFLYARSQISIDHVLFKAGVAMGESKGNMPVSEIASAAHSTVRTLERKFKQSSGYTVKDVSGLIRFEQVRNQLWTDPNSNIAGLADEFGYADQSHLSREFKKYTHTTPGLFAQKTKKGK